MPKDSNKPKRAMGPYNFFIKERRADYVSRNQPIGFTEFSKECSRIWKTLSDGDKKKYSKDAAKDKVRFQDEMASYVPPVDSKGKKKRKKDPNQPKRSLSAFFFFCYEARPKLRAKDPSASVGELAKKLGAEWRNLSEKDRAPFNVSAQKDKARYEQEMAKYKSAISKSADSDDAEADESSLSEGDKEA